MYDALSNPSGAFTMSAFVKKGTGDLFGMRTTSASIIVQFNLTTLEITASFGTGTITNYGNGWYRVTASTSSAIANEVAQYQFFNDAGEYMYFWGAMAENGEYATSYVPTLGATSTRGADACSKTGISSLIGQTQGTLFCDFNWEQKSGVFFINSISDGTLNNEIFMAFGSSADNRIRFSIVTGSVEYVNQDSAVLSSGRYKIAFAYASNDAVVYINGTQLFTDSSVVVPTTSAFKFLRANNTLAFNGNINEQLLFPTRLSNAELAQLTTI
jgi:hypothetical protein